MLEQVSEFSSFLRLNNTPLHVETTLCLFICMGCFHLLATVNDASMSVGVQIPVSVPAFHSFGCIPRSGIGGHTVIPCLTF